MNRIERAALVIILSIVALGAQGKKRTLTMDDLTPQTSQAISQTGGRTGSTDDERNWQRRLEKVEVDLMNLQLSSALDESNLDLKLAIRKRTDEFAALREEGRSRKFWPHRSLERDYRERYIKLRIEIIKEERAHPPRPVRTGEERVYVEARKPKPGQRKISAPVLDSKVVQRPTTKLERMIVQLEELIEEGRRAGIAPGIFRD
jgi:hypothetical protein